MKKYDNNIINNYINGNRNQELEKDKEFMSLIIDKTNDIKYVDYCANELKSDFEFVLFLINKFNNDHQFVTDMIFSYLVNLNKLENSKLNKKIINIDSLITLMNYFPSEKIDITSDEYQELLSIIYCHGRMNYELAKNIDEEIEEGMGFIYFIDIFGINIDILNYFAKRIVNEILQFNGNSFKNLIFSTYNRAEDINSLHELCTQFVTKYDKSLADYLSINYEILEDSFNSIVDDILVNWDNYHGLNNKGYSLIKKA